MQVGALAWTDSRAHSTVKDFMATLDEPNAQWGLFHMIVAQTALQRPIHLAQPVDGIPCWHIECSAIVLDKFKFGIDIQGGGRDLIFPHHEFSAAYAKTVNIGRKFANHYVHNGLIYYNGYKMSKSRGNIILISQLLNSGLDPAALRLAVLSEHYRKDRSWNNLVIERANARLKLWRHATSLSTELETTNLIKNLRQYLAYDLDTPRVLTLVDTWCIDALNCSGYSSNASRQLINALDVLLGIKLF